MTTVGFLKISAIQDSKVKKIAQDSNIETKNNDTIETNLEWRTFLTGIADAFVKGSITYDVATKYVNLSSSVFERRDEGAKGYKEGLCNGLNWFHELCGSRFERWVSYMYDKALGVPEMSKEMILSHADHEEYMKLSKEHIQLLKKHVKSQNELIEAYNKNIESAKKLNKSYDEAIAKTNQQIKLLKETNSNYNDN